MLIKASSIQAFNPESSEWAESSYPYVAPYLRARAAARPPHRRHRRTRTRAQHAAPRAALTCTLDYLALWQCFGVASGGSAVTAAARLLAVVGVAGSR
jgi:hypothetical protein